MLHRDDLRDLMTGKKREQDIPLIIRRYFTDVDGQIIDKAVYGSVTRPRLPVPLFAEMDRQGGYRIAQAVSPSDLLYLCTLTNGLGVPFLFATGFNTIKNQMLPGDIAHVFTNDIQNPTYFVFIVVSCKAVAYASILDNSKTIMQDNKIGTLYSEHLTIKVDNVNQLNFPLYLYRMDNVGTYKADSLQPVMVKSPDNKLTDLVRFRLKFYINQYVGFSFLMAYETDEMSLTFKIEY